MPVCSERKRYAVYTAADCDRHASQLVQRTAQGCDLFMNILSHDFLEACSSRARSSVFRRRDCL